MKTTKRKRSTKAAPSSRASGVDAVAAETSASVAGEGLTVPAAESPVVAAESVPSSGPDADLANELSPAAVEALVAEPVAEPVAVSETLQDAAEQVAELVAEVAVEQVAELAAEPVESKTTESADAAAEPVADVVADAGDASSEPAGEFIDQTAETIVADPVSLSAAEPAPPVEPVVVLAANCSVKDAAALKTSLCAIAHESTAVTLDVSAVERVDTATMQLLCAFVRDRSGRNQGVSWRGESQALQDAVRLLGVAGLLGFESSGAESTGSESRGVAA